MNSTSLFPATPASLLVPDAPPSTSSSSSSPSLHSTNPNLALAREFLLFSGKSAINKREDDGGGGGGGGGTSPLNYQARLSVLSSSSAGASPNFGDDDSSSAAAAAAAGAGGKNDADGEDEEEVEQEEEEQGSSSLSLSLSIGDHHRHHHQQQKLQSMENETLQGHSAAPRLRDFPPGALHACNQDSLEKLRQICNDNLSHAKNMMLNEAASSSSPSPSNPASHHVDESSSSSQDDSINYICHICPYNSLSRHDFNLHVNTHFKFLCCKCEFETKNEDAYGAHLEAEHNMTLVELENEQGIHVPKVNSQGKVKVHKCKTKDCDFTAITKREYWLHSKVHLKGDKTLHCPKCVFVTEYKHHLEYHLRNHYGSKPNKCPECNYTCVNKSMLNSHMKSHTTVYQYRCLDCSYGTKYCHSLKLHLRKYGHKPAMVLNPDGSPNPLPIIDVYGTRRGPKVKKDDKGNIMKPSPAALAAAAAAAAANSLPSTVASSFTSPSLTSAVAGFPLPLMMAKFQEQMHHSGFVTDAALAAAKKRANDFENLSMQPPSKIPYLREKLKTPRLLEKPLKCPLCDFETRQQDIFDNHVMLHDEPFPMDSNNRPERCEEEDDDEDDGDLTDRSTASFGGLHSHYEMERQRKRTERPSAAAASTDDDIVAKSEPMDEEEGEDGGELSESQRASQSLDTILAGIKANLPPGLNYIEYLRKFSPLVMNNINPLASSSFEPPGAVFPPFSLIGSGNLGSRPGNLNPSSSSPSSSSPPPSFHPSRESQDSKEHLFSRIYLESFLKKGQQESKEEKTSESNVLDLSQGQDQLSTFSAANDTESSTNSTAGGGGLTSEEIQEENCRFSARRETANRNSTESVETGGSSGGGGGANNGSNGGRSFGKNRKSRKGPAYKINRKFGSAAGFALGAGGGDSPPSSPNGSGANGSSHKQTIAASTSTQAETSSSQSQDDDGSTSTDPGSSIEDRPANAATAGPTNVVSRPTASNSDKTLTGSHICTHCDIAFLDSLMYDLHMGYHGYKDPFTCNNCGDEMKNKIEFFLHLAKKSHA